MGKGWGQQSIRQDFCNIPRIGHVVLISLEERMFCTPFHAVYSIIDYRLLSEVN